MSDKQKALSFFDSFDARQLNEPEETVAEARKAKKPAVALLAKGLAAFDRYAKDPNNIIAQALPFSDKTDRAGLTGGLSDLLGIPDAASFLDKVAYGDNLTVGKGQTLKPADSVVEGALTVAPALGQGLAAGYKAASKLPKPKSGQVNSLLGGMAGDDPGLWLSHGSVYSNLLKNDDLVRELYNPSFAITRDKLSTFGGSDSLIVPYPDKLDPKNAKTLLTATDSYNPRWHASLAGRVDNLPYGVDLSKGLADPRVAEFVNQRLFEKLGNPFQKQGIKQEGSVSAPKGKLPRLLEGMASATNRFDPVKDSEDWFSHRILMSPRFQSLESFAQSPYGGKIIGDRSGQSTLDSVSRDSDELIKALYVLDRDKNPQRLQGWDSPYGKKTRPTLLKGLASDVHPEELLSRRKDARFTFLDEILFKDETAPGGYRYLNEAQKKEIRQTAGKLLTKAKTAPSDYAELKAYGPWQLSQDNIAGIVGRQGADWSMLEKAAKRRGILFEPADNRADEVAAAKYFLDRKWDTPPLTRGLASSGKFPLPKSNTGEFTKTVDKSKAAFSAWQSAPDDPTLAQTATNKLLDLKDDIETGWNQGFFTTTEKDQMNSFVQKQLIQTKKAQGKSKVAPPPSTVGPFSNDFLNKTVSVSNFDAGHFEYFPESSLDALTSYAKKTGNDPLKAAVEAYKADPAYWKSGIPNDGVTKKLIQEVDAIKSGFTPPEPAVNLATGMAKKAIPSMPVQKINEEGLKNIAELAKGTMPWHAIDKNSATKKWALASQFKKDFPGLTDDQAKILEDISFHSHMNFETGGNMWDSDIKGHMDKLFPKATKPTPKEAEILGLLGVQTKTPEISKADIENMIGFASGDIPWAMKKPNDWVVPAVFKKEFPALTDDQAEALSDLSQQVYFKNKNKASGDSFGHNEKKMDHLTKILLSPFK